MVVAIFSLLLGAQQGMVVDVVLGTNETSMFGFQPVSPDQDHLSCFQNEFWSYDHERPRWWIVFSWQAPLMLVNYSLILLGAGMIVHIVGPMLTDPAMSSIIGPTESKKVRAIESLSGMYPDIKRRS